MKKLLVTFGAVAILGLGACSTTSDSFVAERTGVAVIKGRITQVENLSAANIRRFADGLSVTVNRPGCKVYMSFSQTEKQVMEVGPGTIIIYGDGTDYVLRHAPGTPSR